MVCCNRPKIRHPLTAQMSEVSSTEFGVTPNPETPHRVNTVKSEVGFLQKGTFENLQHSKRERNVLADVIRRDEVIVRGSMERGNEKCDG